MKGTPIIPKTSKERARFAPSAPASPPSAPASPPSAPASSPSAPASPALASPPSAPASPASPLTPVSPPAPLHAVPQIHLLTTRPAVSSPDRSHS
ncbi:merozoite surface protein CMZ-8-like [Gadus macrocephalus]|uniref:merozoite surface protein CMZ-8-like n=1 Tax=Gadus macrocephalus TaxID=80720 RepID=UPI0028CB3F9F|nr:merozoite surface protein CMZ-8-like [Gadus macrocephalus]